MKDKKNLNTEVDLVAFISLLSVCICFLLLTAIWIQIGSLNVKQAVGGQPASKTKKVPALWTKMQDDGRVMLQLQDFPRTARRQIGHRVWVPANSEGEINFEDFQEKISNIKSLVPDLKTGLVLPRGNSRYENVIRLMDHMKQEGLVDLEYLLYEKRGGVIMSRSFIKQPNIFSPLMSSSTLNPRGQRFKKNLAQTLMLTSLVDAFSILVIYLLMSYSSSGEIMYISKDMKLPSATEAEVLSRQIIIKFEHGKYFIENEEVRKQDLFVRLLKMKTEFKEKYPELDGENKIIIQADKDEKYLDLNTIIHASAQAGFEEIKFAVISSSG